MNDSFHHWWRSARWPLSGFLVAAVVLSLTNADVAIARSLFFDPNRMQWIGAHSGWVAVLHTQGRWAIRLIIAAALCGWLATFVWPSLIRARRPAACLFVSMTLSVGIVGMIKLVANVDCPWDLTLFGGKYPYIHLFADRPDYLRAAACFPAAHASSGYALMSLYFLFRDRSMPLARAGLFAGIATGLAFGIAQQARGAHFVSHDLWSAILCWIIPLTVYTFAFRRNVWRAPIFAGASTDPAPVSAEPVLD